MPARPVVVNNTPLVALWVLERLDLLRELFDEVLIPEAVADEFLATEGAARRVALDEAPWIRVVPLASRVACWCTLGLIEVRLPWWRLRRSKMHG